MCESLCYSRGSIFESPETVVFANIKKKGKKEGIGSKKKRLSTKINKIIVELKKKNEKFMTKEYMYYGNKEMKGNCIEQAAETIQQVC